MTGVVYNGYLISEKPRARGCSVHEDTCLTNPNLTQGAWKIAREWLVVLPRGKLEEADSNINDRIIRILSPCWKPGKAGSNIGDRLSRGRSRVDELALECGGQVCKGKMIAKSFAFVHALFSASLLEGAGHS